MNLIPIGQFSKMTRLSVKALRLYDDNGLLPPARIDPSTKYRYYHVEQAHRAEIIRVLRSLQMPLNEISEVLNADSDQEKNQLLLAHKARLANRLAAQERSMAYLESIIQREEIVMSYDIQVSEEATQQIAAVKIHTSISKIASDIQSGFGKLMTGLGQASAAPSGAPMILYHNVIDEESDGDIEIAVPVTNGFKENGEVYGRELEGGAMATTIHRGRYEEIAAAYHSLTAWVAQNNYEIAGPTREIYVNDPQTVAPADLLTRLEFPIVSKD